MYTKVKTDTEIANMRTSGQMLAKVLDVLVAQAEPGMTGLEAARLASKELKALGGKPAFLGYMGFTDVICISINDEVVHGPPDKREFKADDLVSFDFGVNYKGMITDAARTVIIGGPEAGDADTRRLVEATRESLNAAIKAVKGPTPTGDIGAAVQAVLERNHLGIVRDLVGHGVGHQVHEDPNIPNYGQAGQGPTLEVGMTVAIEPMATLGKDDVYVKDNGWTYTTKDGSLSAHFEDTILITEHGADILTR